MVNFHRHVPGDPYWQAVRVNENLGLEQLQVAATARIRHDPHAIHQRTHPRPPQEQLPPDSWSAPYLGRQLEEQPFASGEPKAQYPAVIPSEEAPALFPEPWPATATFSVFATQSSEQWRAGPRVQYPAVIPSEDAPAYFPEPRPAVPSEGFIQEGGAVQEREPRVLLEEVSPVPILEPSPEPSPAPDQCLEPDLPNPIDIMAAAVAASLSGVVAFYRVAVLFAYS